MQSLRPQRPRLIASHRQEAYQPGVSLMPMDANVPKPCQGRRQMQTCFGLPAARCPLQGRPKVIMFQLQTVEPLHLPRAVELALGLLGEIQKERKMAIYGSRRFT